MAKAQPIQIELLNQSSWWLPWLPLLGSLLVAIAAVVGVLVNNRTNRRAIDAADERAHVDRQHARDSDFRTWKRDTILATSTGVVQTALNAQDEYFRIAYDPNANALSVDPFLKIDEYGREIGAATASLLIMGEHSLAHLCREIRNAINSKTLFGTVAALGDANRSLTSEYGGQEDADEVTRLQGILDPLLEAINQARGDFGQAAEVALLMTTIDVPPASPSPLPDKRVGYPGSDGEAEPASRLRFRRRSRRRRSK